MTSSPTSQQPPKHLEFGALIKFSWYNQHVDTYSKYLIFRAIQMNLLLWGCKHGPLMKLKVFLAQNV
jgi:hypothetical protein